MVLTRDVSRLHQVHNSRHLRSGRLVDVVQTTKVGALALSTKSKLVRGRPREWGQSKIGDLIDRHEADDDHGPDSVMGHEPGHTCAATEARRTLKCLRREKRPQRKHVKVTLQVAWRIWVRPIHKWHLSLR